MEGEEGAGLRSPQRRRISLLLSILLQLFLLVGLTLTPLLATGERLRATPLAPAPPYYGTRLADDPTPPRPPNGTPKRPPKPTGVLHYEPKEVPKGVAEIRDAEQVPDLGVAPYGTIGIPGMPEGIDPRAPFDPRTPRPPIAETPAVPEPAKRVRITEINPAQLIHRVQPIYPPLAVRTRTQGTVVLRAVIGTDGAVREVQVIAGHPLLIQAALDAVMQWRYQPTLLNGRPVEVETRITVIFTLNR
jgi:protein TonB